jgi:hypothetical protein
MRLSASKTVPLSPISNDVQSPPTHAAYPYPLTHSHDNSSSGWLRHLFTGYRVMISHAPFWRAFTKNKGRASSHFIRATYKINRPHISLPERLADNFFGIWNNCFVLRQSAVRGFKNPLLLQRYRSDSVHSIIIVFTSSRVANLFCMREIRRIFQLKKDTIWFYKNKLCACKNTILRLRDH